MLPPLVANQIAAGEVVERPASVVKELVENAIDAGATRIAVELEGGGIELVRVTDDGSGIHAEDLLLAVAPHATSKIASAQDLDGVATLGFRGEALASIASVARVSIRSRTSAEAAASVLEVEGDACGAVRPAAGPVGTSLAVRNLFFNTPARRKFLRTPATEQERCLDVLRHVAMAHPAVGFAATVEGRRPLDLPAGQSPKERAVAILGRELAGQLIEVHADEFDDSRGVAIWGLAGLPAIARGTNKSQHVFVNGRAIRDRTIAHAIAEAYRGLIEPSRFPTVVLMLEMSPAGIDVNVHPAKAEVRFRDSSLVHSAVLRALRRALQGADLTPTYGDVRGGVVKGLPPELPGSGIVAQGGAAAGGPDDPAGATARFVGYFQRFAPGRPDATLADAIAGTVPAGTPGGATAGSAPPPRPSPALESPSLVPTAPASRVLQVHNSYLVTQDEQGVVIIDQHALHERVMFEYLLARVRSGGLESQRLLAPAPVPASAGQLRRLEEVAPLLARIGVSAAALGPATIGVHAFPTFLFDRGVDPVEFMRELLDKADAGLFSGGGSAGGAGGENADEDALRDVLDMMSCKAAVKAGDHLSDIELGELVKLRGDVERSSNCPHGRPTSIRLTIRELEKLFGRA